MSVATEGHRPRQTPGSGLVRRLSVRSRVSKPSRDVQSTNATATSYEMKTARQEEDRHD